jgi:AcrR family transcriptional regulator
VTRIEQPETFQRARTPAQKQQRRDAILTAARALALRNGVGNVTLAAIAEEVGLAKSNVLSYFGTLDAIYLHLVNEEWREWATVAAAGLTGAATGPAEIADALSLSFAGQPLLCDLLAHAVRYVEHGVSADDVHAQQLMVGPAVDHLVTKIVDALPQLSKPVATDLMLLTAIAGGALWLRANPSPALKSLYKTNPAMPAAFIDFAATLRTLVRTLLEGILASDEPPQRLIHQRHGVEAVPNQHDRH